MNNIPTEAKDQADLATMLFRASDPVIPAAGEHEETKTDAFVLDARIFPPPMLKNRPPFPNLNALDLS
jgi:hypothetical protein